MKLQKPTALMLSAFLSQVLRPERMRLFLVLPEDQSF